MWLVLAYGFGGICFGLLGFVAGLCVGIEEERQRKKLKDGGLANDAPRATGPGGDRDLDRLGVVRLD